MNTPAAPRTTREALLAEALGDLDRLLARIEAVPALIDGLEARLLASARTLDEAGDRYRLAVTHFTEASKQDLAEYGAAQRGQLVALSTDTLADHARALQEATRATLRAELATLGPQSGALALESQARRRPRLGERLAQMAGTALLAAVLMFALLRFLPAR